MFSKKRFFSYRLIKVIIIIIIFGILIFLNPRNFFDPLRVFFFQISYPIKKISFNMFFFTKEIKDFFFSIGKIKKENEEQALEIQLLKSRLTALLDMERENAFLREQLKLLPRDKFKLEAASIIAQDKNGLGDWIEIDKGEKNGIKKEMPVIVSQGILVGKVSEVYPKSAKIILITNPESLINAVNVKSNAHGLIKGEYGLGVVFDMVLQTETISVGDEIITSELSQNIPRGLLIGKIQEIRSSSNHLFQQAEIKIPFKLSDLQYVFVIKEYNY